MATYVSWKSLTGAETSEEELQAALTTLSKTELIRACSQVNTLLRTWEGNIDLDVHAQLLRILFTPTYADELDRRARNSQKAEFVFHRQQLLYLTLKGAIHCAETAEGAGPGFQRTFAECCLKANDLLDYGLQEDVGEDRILNLMAGLMPASEYSAGRGYLRKVARTRVFLDDILQSPRIRDLPEYMDVPELFGRVVGISAREYTTLIIGTLAKYLALKPAEVERDADRFLVRQASFSALQMPAEKIALFLKDVSTDASNLGASAARISGKNDFTVLRDRPLLHIGQNGYFPMDIGFLADKLENGLFWRVHNEALSRKDERDQLHALWGMLFDEYVTRLFSGVCKEPANRFLSHPCFQNEGEACDGIILCGGSTAVIMEYKGSTLTASAKYSGSSELLSEQLEMKFVGTEERPKGVRQLARVINKLGDKRNPQKVEGLERVATVYPVLVARDDGLGAPFVNRFLGRRFATLYDRKQIRPKVTPLFVLTIDELEEISAYLTDVPMDEILESKYKADQSQLLPFSAIQNDRLAEVPLRQNESLVKRFEDVINEACLDLFGWPFERPDGGERSP
jgi:hypothetical protein